MPSRTNNSSPTAKAAANSTAAKAKPATPPARKPSTSSARKPAATSNRSRGKGSAPRFSIAIPPHLQQEMLAVALAVAGALIALSLMAKDEVGLVGGVGDALQAVFGVAAWVVPLTLWAAAAMLLIARLRHIDRLRWEMPLGLLFILCAIVGLIHMPETDKLGAAEEHLAGGYVGYYVSSMVSTVAGTTGGAVILIALALVGAMLAFHISLGEIARLFGRGGQALIHLFTAEVPARPAIITAPHPVPAQGKGKAAAAPAPIRADEHDGIPLDVPVNGKRRGAAPAPGEAPEPALRILGRSPEEIAAAKTAPPAIPAAPRAADPAAPTPAATPTPNSQPPTPAPPTVNGMAPLRSGAEIAKQLNLPMAGNSGMLWKLPTVDLLERVSDVEINDRDLREKAKKIEETLATFGVAARVREINSGPTVTQFALEPGEGVRVARIAALHNDLALALAAPSLRIEAPVPGMSRVGIEVPNTVPGMVGLRNILEADVFRAGKGKLKIPIGRDTHGQPVTTDLAKLPHLLIAGATGSGKSVAINSLIVSFLMQHTPDELRFLMIDPKRVELSSFNGIPHLLRPVVTEMRPEKDTGGSRSKQGPREITAIEVLKWLLWEMERRYRLFAKGAKDKDGVTKVYRNIEQYHTAAHANPTVMEPLPYIVLIIDELADLMLVAPEDVETALCRLAQLARATGIHLIIATQRPSVDVVTGLIKANFPARLAFAVTSMIDSRVILDTPGAEKLLGRGDALYTASDEAKPIRVQGTFVSDKEAERVVNFWRVQMAPLLAAAPAPATPGHPGDGTAPAVALPQTNVPEPDWLKDLDAGGDGTEEDSMLKDAIALVKRSKYASTSMLQRRLRIGYNRAARLIEQMEDMGIVGPGDGARPREVLVTDDSGPEPGGEDEE